MTISEEDKKSVEEERKNLFTTKRATVEASKIASSKFSCFRSWPSKGNRLYGG